MEFVIKSHFQSADIYSILEFFSYWVLFHFRCQVILRVFEIDLRLCVIGLISYLFSNLLEKEIEFFLFVTANFISKS
jgi:hypothetical protein